MSPEEFYKPLVEFEFVHPEFKPLTSLLRTMFDNFNKASGEQAKRLEELAITAYNAH